MGTTGSIRILRREVLALGASVLTVAVSGCDKKTPWHESDISGSLPPLSFSMTNAMTGKPITGADFRGKVALLYFGYTLCPDFCPTTLTNLAGVLKKLGAQAKDVRVLFVTVDPNRDTLPVLKRYVALFAPQMVGLRGTPDELAALARRYRVAYSVTPAHHGHAYEVTHSSLVYVFDQNGNARLLVDSMATQKPDVVGTEDDLRRLIEQHQPMGWWEKVERAV
jgi:protein SCO1/2